MMRSSHQCVSYAFMYNSLPGGGGSGDGGSTITTGSGSLLYILRTAEKY